jgi:hypothetical protein
MVSRNPIRQENDNNKLPFCNVYICMWRLTFNLLGTPILTSLDLSNVAGKLKTTCILTLFSRNKHVSTMSTHSLCSDFDGSG